jgi:hypothetical protein
VKLCADESRKGDTGRDPEDSLEPQLPGLRRQAVQRLSANLIRNAPQISDAVTRWAANLSPTGVAEDYFRKSRAHLLLLPWWAEKSIRGAPDLRFQSDLIYSSVNGYYFVRLIDNVMDGHGKSELRMLPILGFFHSQFQSVYGDYFKPDSAFWEFFHSTWTAMAQAAMLDANMTEISTAEFVRVAAVKSAGAKIPVAAVLFRHRRQDLLPQWCEFYDALLCWSRMVDDVFDSLFDAQKGTMTHFLSDAKRRKRSGESVASWIVKGGLASGYKKADSLLQRVRDLAHGLGSSELVKYLECRQEELASCWKRMEPGLAALARLANVLE